MVTRWLAEVRATDLVPHVGLLTYALTPHLSPQTTTRTPTSPRSRSRRRGVGAWEGGGWRDAGALSIVTCCPVKAVKTRFAPQIEAAPPSPNPLAALPRDRGRRPDAACQTTEVDEASLGAVIRANLSMADGKELLQDVVRPGGTTDSPHPVGPPHDRGRSPRSSGTVPSHGGWFKRKGACH